MDHKLDHEKAPAEHVQAWNGIKKLITQSTIGIIVILLLMAFFLGG